MTRRAQPWGESLQRLYESFNAPDTAMDPIQIVRRYARVEDREIVAFVAAGLAFGRVASVMASVDAVCRVMGPSPAEFVRRFDRRRLGVGGRGLRRAFAATQCQRHAQRQYASQLFHVHILL